MRLRRNFLIPLVAAIYFLSWTIAGHGIREATIMYVVAANIVLAISASIVARIIKPRAKLIFLVSLYVAFSVCIVVVMVPETQNHTLGSLLLGLTWTVIAYEKQPRESRRIH